MDKRHRSHAQLVLSPISLHAEAEYGLGTNAEHLL